MKVFPLLSLVLACLLVSCGTGPSIRPEACLVVKDVRIPDDEPWFSRFARHTWVDYREKPGRPWHRIEIVNQTSGLIHREISQSEFDQKSRWGQKVVVRGQSDGLANPDFVREIARLAQEYDASRYRAYPGPNSNTFAGKLIRKVDGLFAVLDHNAVGKEWGFHAGRSAGGTGVELQTPLLGVALGLREGVEVSLFGFSGGFSLAPPSLKIPILPAFPQG